MAKILVNRELATHPRVRQIPAEQRAAAVDLWILGVSWLAHQRATRAVLSGCSVIPAGVVKGLVGEAGHRPVWALVSAGLWLEGNDFWAQPGPDNMPPLPDGSSPRTRGRALEYLVTNDEPDELWRIDIRGRRWAIPDRIRSAVYSRDGYACVVCGTAGDLTLDHIQPWSHGGSDRAENLQTMCRSCNSRKGARV